MSFKVFVLLGLELHIIKTVNAENEFQQTSLPEPVDSDDNGLMQFPKSIKLQMSGAVLSRRSKKVVLRYNKPKKNIQPEKYSHSLLILFYHLQMKTLHGSYAAKLNEENVLEIANQNKQKFESNGDLIGSYVHKIHLEKRHMFRDDYSLDNMGFDLETDNLQINNKIDCNGILQQIASLQVDDNDF